MESVEEVAEELLETFNSQVLPRLGEISDEGKRFLYFIAWLNSEAERRGLGRIIITGGFAIEIYTARAYRTMDVDLIVEGRALYIVKEFLRRFSEAIGRGFLPRYEVLQLKSIDIVSSTYGRRVEPTKIIVNGFTVYVEPIEELLIIYLVGWKFWGATEDRDKAIWLYMVQKGRINEKYLEERAREEGVSDYLEKIRELTSTTPQQST